MGNILSKDIISIVRCCHNITGEEEEIMLAMGSNLDSNHQTIAPLFVQFADLLLRYLDPGVLQITNRRE